MSKRKQYAVFLDGKEYGKYKAGSTVTVTQPGGEKGAKYAFSSEDVNLSQEFQNRKYVISFEMPERDVSILSEKTSVIPDPEPEPSHGNRRVDFGTQEGTD